ncbi:hypothetical protein BASA81_008086 [Batrachochytrium salamandrivorans]|nr:hypothetical protein BASA81_008086 [Batrachochytrium salamandrivorans]
MSRAFSFGQIQNNLNSPQTGSNHTNMDALSSLKQSLEEIREFRKQYEVGELSSSHDRGLQLERQVKAEKTENLLLRTKLHEMELALSHERNKSATLASQHQQLQLHSQEQADLELVCKRKHKRLVLSLGEKLALQTRELEEKNLLLRGAVELERELQRANKQIAQLLTKLHDLERVALPSAMDEKRQLELRVSSLQQNLQDSLDTEAMLRELLLKEQANRAKRRGEAI